jgi:hypothetical protein
VSGCGCKLAPGQWWNWCGETDMGQTMPALCERCQPGGHVRADDPDAANVIRHRDALIRAYGRLHARGEYDNECQVCGAHNSEIFTGRAFICEPANRKRSASPLCTIIWVGQTK